MLRVKFARNLQDLLVASVHWNLWHSNLMSQVSRVYLQNKYVSLMQFFWHWCNSSDIFAICSNKIFKEWRHPEKLLSGPQVRFDNGRVYLRWRWGSCCPFCAKPSPSKTTRGAISILISAFVLQHQNLFLPCLLVFVQISLRSFSLFGLLSFFGVLPL